MAGRVIVRVEGGARLKRTLRAAGDDLQDLKEAHAEAAAIVEPVGRGKAPRGITGRLAGSVRGSGTKQGATIRAGSSAIPYAKVQEFGWAAHHIAAQPYLVPAAVETQPEWYGRYQAAVESIIGRVKGA